MPQHVLLVLDGPRVHGESFFYARELAKRMDLAFRVLLLDQLPARAAEKTKASEIISTILSAARAFGLSAEGRAEYGDQGSELLKYLAAEPGTRCIVWGGDPDVLRPGRRRQASHWLAKVREGLGWPIAGAVGKDEDGGSGGEKPPARSKRREKKKGGAKPKP